MFDAELISDFINEAYELIAEVSVHLLQLEQNPADLSEVNAIFRGFHTIKGAASFLHLEDIVKLCHAQETLFDEVRMGNIMLDVPLCSASLHELDKLQAMLGELAKQAQQQAINSTHPENKQNKDQQDITLASVTIAPAAIAPNKKEEPKSCAELIKVKQENSLSVVNEPIAPAVPPKVEITAIKVATNKLDKIINLVGELVLLRNRLLRLSNENSEAFSEACSALNNLTCDLQSAVMQTRMQPLKNLFSKFGRVVRDTALELNKQVDLKISGAETELDKNLVEALENPLIHLLRNALDHGIEDPSLRIKKGKAATGQITLSAQQTGEQIIINLQDDGAGLDHRLIFSKAVEQGLIAANANLSEQQCFNLIFAPGLSTKNNVSNISGRGVGMDVVKTDISKIGGQVELSSKLGRGTNICIKLPLTLAILPTLMVKVEAYIVAFTVASVKEIITFDAKCVSQVGNQILINVRGTLLPLFYLHDLLQVYAEKQPSYVVITQTAQGLAGFAVDNLLGQEEVIIKALGTGTNVAHGFAGATITSAGQIALVLDVGAILG